jgi:hypothetical protein
MQLDSARGLKASLISDFITPIAAAVEARALSGVTGRRASAASAGFAEAGHEIRISDVASAVGAQPLDAIPKRQRTIALGISPTERGDYKIAVRVQRPALLHSQHVQKIVEDARGEADVRLIGRVDKRVTRKPRRRASARPATHSSLQAAKPWYQSHHMPLLIGSSVGHHLITAGSIGCFVRDRVAGATYILSNNHVLANEDNAKVGDAILQPGRYDGGRNPQDIVATLTNAVKLKLKSPNRVDCAIAALTDGVAMDPRRLRGILGSEADGELGELCADDVLDEGLIVRKVGRTTGATVGRITAFEVDNVVVNYGVGNLRFDGQIEIEGTTASPFSDGGDSGSIIVTDKLCAIALLFAGSETGGENGHGLTFANPLSAVLTALKVSIL